VALTIGTQDAQSGLTGDIYGQLDVLLSPPLQQAVDDASGDAQESAQAALDAARDGWKKLAFAVATGVVSYLVANMEIVGVQTSGNVSAPVSGQLAVQNGVVFTQSNDGPGRVR
jgi:hypothetical protein